MRFSFRSVAPLTSLFLVSSQLTACGASTPTPSHATQPDEPAVAADAPDPQSLGRRFTQLLYAADDTAVWDHFSAKMIAAMGTVDAWAQTRTGIMEQLGAEVEVVREDVVDSHFNRLYWRLARFEKVPEEALHMQWTFDADWKIAGFSVSGEQREAESQFLDYVPRTEFRLPFTSTWYVYWGGRSVIQNYHTRTPNQRFAYDFIVVRDGRSHSGDGSSNEHYYCHTLPVVAPAAGRVHAASDGVAENTPGEMNSEQILGNHVVLDHGNNEFSFFAHFKTGSVKVEAGQQVDAGTLLGECGNSGHSSEPHLHYHLQNTPDLSDGEGLPVFFHDYQRNGETVERGEPIQGEFVGPNAAGNESP